MRPRRPPPPIVSESPDDPWPAIRGLPMGQRLEITGADGHRWAGTLVPPHELSGERIVQLKLDNGYNVGIRVDPGSRFRLLESDPAPPDATSAAARAPVPDTSAPWIALLTTGGTIASRVDYRTGGVRPVREESEILAFYPELARGGPVRIIPVFDRLSEEIAPADWAELTARVVRAFTDGARGVVIAHGTDTLAYTAAALSFALGELAGPVVLVGAQRSPDRPSSDGFTNLAAAVRLAREGRLGEVVVVMHAGLSDDRFAIHRGTRVRKMHSSRRDAFRSQNGPPLGYIDAEGIHWTTEVRDPVRGASADETRFDAPAGLLWFYPGLSAEKASTFAERLRGVVLAGTGLGHVSALHLDWIRAAVDRGVVVVMTTQCLEGGVDPYVYATGRELLRAGVLYVGDLLPETAYVKLVWALGASRDPAETRRRMLEDRAGEFAPRHSAETA